MGFRNIFAAVGFGFLILLVLVVFLDKWAIDNDKAYAGWGIVAIVVLTILTAIVFAQA